MDYELIKPDKDDAYDPAPFLNYARARRTDKEERDAIVGDAVHLWLGGGCHAAIVRNDDDLDTVSLIAFPREGDLPPAYRDGISHSEEKVYDTWHWPCGGQ